MLTNSAVSKAPSFETTFRYFKSKQIMLNFSSTTSKLVFVRAMRKLATTIESTTSFLLTLENNYLYFDSYLDNTYSGGSSPLFALKYNFCTGKMSHGYMYV